MKIVLKVGLASLSIIVTTSTFAFGQGVCSVQCPEFAPMFHNKDMVCLERSAEPVGLEDIVMAAGGGLSGLAEAVFGSLKDRIVDYANSAPEGPDCNWAAQLFPDTPINNETHAQCKTALDKIASELRQDPPIVDKAQRNFVVFCRGNFLFGDFPMDDYAAHFD